MNSHQSPVTVQSVMPDWIRHPDANAQNMDLDIADNIPLMKRILKTAIHRRRVQFGSTWHHFGHVWHRFGSVWRHWGQLWRRLGHVWHHKYTKKQRFQPKKRMKPKSNTIFEEFKFQSGRPLGGNKKPAAW